ncbi:adenosine deaminase [Sediminibacillus dalangtanensis]|uniref:Adenosine deaminase n=1 Tax=Sediminibacillus dalangtanensis TaxID=2729421 RepID=A0ABX7VX49_9BACI|nr:adenosine deaminase [Sediminibacillus dalangtanensis]QTN00600.1 adenosine deaminase [Sediminibacillus dalangtanensis]
MPEKKLMELIRRLPKVDLHVHLDGSVRPGTAIELAKQQRIELPEKEIDKLLPHMQIAGECNNLEEYLEKFQLIGPLLQTPESLELSAYETVKQAYDQNCLYMEVRFGPQLHRQLGLSLDQSINAAITGLKKGEAAFGVKANVIVCCLRHHSTSLNCEVVEAAASFLGKGLVGIDLAGDEAGYPAKLFEDVFALAASKRLPVTIHAGEAAGPVNIKDAIEKLGAVRIGHGVRLREDPDLLAAIAAEKIPLEMCPVSNIQTKAAASWEDYPLRDYFDRGLSVTVNTDNLTVSNTTITREYAILADRFGFSVEELVQLVRNGIEAAFLGEEDKQALKRKLETFVLPT